MTNWTDYVKSFAKANNTTYGCALSDPACSAGYRKKFGNKKPLGKKISEKEMMGQEDIASTTRELTDAKARAAARMAKAREEKAEKKRLNKEKKRMKEIAKENESYRLVNESMRKIAEKEDLARKQAKIDAFNRVEERYAQGDIAKKYISLYKEKKMTSKKHKEVGEFIKANPQLDILYSKDLKNLYENYRT